ncbi:type II toxin-antitoxin system antitoxin SocA domain-containing protein [Mucilaginibacter sp. UYCu711]|uniref:type II toxin-antitoxin system antitoxin SocA domain-containing protein n=1 Tax=Mucilaginibacter sp. UYCu711 TaxID=3156339 RepID=UPI003D246FD0
MKSPITGKEMALQKEKRVIIFRKEEFSVVYHYLKCIESEEQFTSTELDEINMLQVYNKYREAHKLPYPEQIKELRDRYKISAIKMADILGFGANMYRNYENGEVPSESNSRLIQLAQDPEKFKHLIVLSGVYTVDEERNILRHLDELIEREKQSIWSFSIEDYLLGFDSSIGIHTGYTLPNLEKLRQMIIYFTASVKPWKTKMNKLLFYADFVNFRKTCFSISGTQYRAIDMGPVPNNFNSIFEFAADHEDINIERKSFPSGALGEKFLPNPERKFNPDLFNDDELASLNEVVTKFKNTSVSDIIETSHLEKAWYENYQDGKKLISYEYGFELETI